MNELENFLKETLIFQNILGINESFDFISNRNNLPSSKYNNKKTTGSSDKNKDTYNSKTDNVYKTQQTVKQTINENNCQTKEFCSKILSADEKELTKEETDNKTIIKNNKKDSINTNLSKIITFDDLEKEIQNFNGCDLKRYAKNTVIFDGNKNAEIMLIGEAPGETEDLEGKPFCGQSGKLLRKALDCINLNTSNLLITNTIYWRPPENRKPTEEELNMCKPFLLKMIQIVKPKIVILCGATAIENILNIKPKMSETAGTTKTIDIDFEQTKLTIKAFSIYHPSFLLRQPSMKKTFWKHLLKLQDEINKK